MSSEETTGQIPNAVLGEAWSEYCYPQTAEGPYAPRFKRAMAVVNQWLAGRAVVDLPEPGEQRDATVAWHPGNPLNYGASVVAYADSMGSWVDVVQVEGEIHTKPRVARLIAAALLAAADAAERLSGEVRNGQ